MRDAKENGVKKMTVRLFCPDSFLSDSRVTHNGLGAGSHFYISISTSINVSIRKIRKIRVNRGYISIIIRNGTFFHFLMLTLMPTFMLM